jgi:hypothetical protein
MSILSSFLHGEHTATQAFSSRNGWISLTLGTGIHSETKLDIYWRALRYPK